MYINLIFGGYIGAVFLGLASLCVILLSAAQKDFPKSRDFFLLSAFAAVECAYSLLYFMLYYREAVLDLLWLSAPWRILDYALSGLQPALWVLLLERMGKKKSPWFHRLDIAVSGGYILCAWAAAAFYMDEYYHISDPMVRRFALALELVFPAVMAGLLVSGCLRMGRQKNRWTQFCVYLISAALLLLGLTQSTMSWDLYAGSRGASLWQAETTDPTGLLLIIINAAMLLFLLQTDYSPVYIGREKRVQTAPLGDQTSLLDIAARTYGLTPREREILELVYDGCSNPEIAAKLHIAPNTVKRHLHNIFEKLEVTARIELVHRVNEGREPAEPSK